MNDENQYTFTFSPEQINSYVVYIPNMSHAGESISKMLDKKPAKQQGPKRYIIKSFYVMQHKKFSHTLKNSASLVEYNAT